jgi:hypothetical protein
MDQFAGSGSLPRAARDETGAVSFRDARVVPARLKAESAISRLPDQNGWLRDCP